MSGFLWQTSPGTWHVRIEAPRDPVTGRRRRVNKTVHGSRKDAQRVLNELAVEVDRGKYQGTATTFDRLVHQWLEVAKVDLSPTTLRGYQQRIERNILPALGKRPVKDITVRDLDRFYRALSDQEGLSPGTVRVIHAIIRRAFRQGQMWGWVDANPAANATPPKMVRPDLAPPDVEQVGELLRVATQREPSFGHFLYLAATTGARRGEMCALRWRNVDLEKGELFIERSIAEVKGGLLEKSTKTHSSRRIALDPASLSALRAQRSLVEEWAAQTDMEVTEDSYVFTWEPDGAIPWTPDSVSRRFSDVRNAIGLTNVRLHDLRHFAATRMMAAGVPVRTVSGRLGHANPSTTLGVYAHFVQSSDREAANILGDIVGDAKRGGPKPKSRSKKAAATPSVTLPKKASRKATML